MARGRTQTLPRPLRADVQRPTECPRGHTGSTIWLEGSYGRSSPHHRRIRFRCTWTDPATNERRRHRFASPERMRHPMPTHPHAGDACPTCDHTYAWGEGPRLPRNFVFTYQEAAKVLFEVGRGTTLRQASAMARDEALRHKQAPRPNRQRDDEHRSFRRRGTGLHGESTEATLAAAYLDTLAPIILAEFPSPAWPKVISVDQTPLRSRQFVRGAWRAGNEKTGFITVAMDQTPYGRAVPVLIAFTGGKDTRSWRSFFTQLNGFPEWIVSDDDAGLRKFMEEHPETTHFRCEYHLQQNAKAAAKKDGVGEWEQIKRSRKSDKERGVFADAEDLTKAWRVSELYVAIERCQRSATMWARLKKLAGKLPVGKDELRRWISANEALIVKQRALHRANPSHCTATGAVEHVVNWISDAIDGRRSSFKNLQRLNTVLALMRMHHAGLASERAYTAILRRHFEDADRAHPIDWRANLDASDTKPSIDQAIDLAMLQTAARRSKRHRAWAKERSQEVKAQFRGDTTGIPGNEYERPADEKVSMKGKMVADVPSLMRFWDKERNHEDPRLVRATSSATVHWRCDRYPDLHRWTGSLRNRAYNQGGCGYCSSNRLSATSSLATLYPDLAKELHPAKNGDLTADEVMAGSNRLVWWKCGKCRHVWAARVAARAGGGSNCQVCRKRDERKRETAAKVRRARDAREGGITG